MAGQADRLSGTNPTNFVERRLGTGATGALNVMLLAAFPTATMVGAAEATESPQSPEE